VQVKDGVILSGSMRDSDGDRKAWPDMPSGSEPAGCSLSKTRSCLDERDELYCPMNVTPGVGRSRHHVDSLFKLGWYQTNCYNTKIYKSLPHAVCGELWHACAGT
jgi:hypothetical protein